MKRQYLIIVICLLSSMFSNSQEFTIGARGGFNNYAIGDINSRGGSFQTGHPDELFSPTKRVRHTVWSIFKY